MAIWEESPPRRRSRSTKVVRWDRTGLMAEKQGGLFAEAGPAKGKMGQSAGGLYRWHRELPTTLDFVTRSGKLMDGAAHRSHNPDSGSQGPTPALWRRAGKIILSRGYCIHVRGIRHPTPFSNTYKKSISVIHRKMGTRVLGRKKISIISQQCRSLLTCGRTGTGTDHILSHLVSHVSLYVVQLVS